MMIASIPNSSSSAPKLSPAAGRSSAASFADAISDASDGVAFSVDRQKESSASGIAKLGDAIAAFKKEAALTPAQRARRDVLKAMDLTEDAIKEMKPEQREAVEKKIAVEVARRLRLDENRGAHPGSVTAITCRGSIFGK